VVEATGGYEQAVAGALAAAGHAVVVVNPRQPRAFARATGLLAKTDRLDALLLARFGSEVDLPVRARRDQPTGVLVELGGCPDLRGTSVTVHWSCCVFSTADPFVDVAFERRA
jgi:transposase